VYKLSSHNSKKNGFVHGKQRYKCYSHQLLGGEKLDPLQRILISASIELKELVAMQLMDILLI